MILMLCLCLLMPYILPRWRNISPPREQYRYFSAKGSSICSFSRDDGGGEVLGPRSTRTRSLSSSVVLPDPICWSQRPCITSTVL